MVCSLHSDKELLIYLICMYNHMKEQLLLTLNKKKTNTSNFLKTKLLKIEVQKPAKNHKVLQDHKIIRIKRNIEKKDEILSFATTWMNLENITLSEVNNKYYISLESESHSVVSNSL